MKQMSDSVPTVSLHISSFQMRATLSRLTTYLLEEQYAFLQTFHSGQHTEFEIFQQSGQVVIRLIPRATESVSLTGKPTESTDEHTQAGETSRLIQRLLEVCNPG